MSMLIQNKFKFIFLIVIMIASNPINTIRNTVTQPNDNDSNSVVVEISQLVSNNQVFKKDVSTKQMLIVKIQGNPTTGYGWYLDKPETLDTSVIKPLNLDENGSAFDYQTDPHPPGFVGVPGSYYFKFQPVKANSNIDLKFVNKRPWMPDQDIKKVKVKINITE